MKKTLIWIAVAIFVYFLLFILKLLPAPLDFCSGLEDKSRYAVSGLIFLLGVIFLVWHWNMEPAPTSKT